MDKYIKDKNRIKYKKLEAGSWHFKNMLLQVAFKKMIEATKKLLKRTCLLNNQINFSVSKKS